jgi:uracil DNA glycosylase
MQDPYHDVGQAEGWAFSVPKGQRVPSSLQNIYKELESDLGCTIPKHGHLADWVGQGVLLLNTSLTVEVCYSALYHTTRDSICNVYANGVERMLHEALLVGMNRLALS